MLELFNKIMDIWYRGPIYRGYYWLRYHKLGIAYKGKHLGSDSEPIWQIYERGDCLKIGDYISKAPLHPIAVLIKRITVCPQCQNNKNKIKAFCLPTLTGGMTEGSNWMYPVTSFNLKQEEIPENWLLKEESPWCRVKPEVAIGRMLSDIEEKKFTADFDKKNRAYTSSEMQGRRCYRSIEYRRPYNIKINN